MFLSSWRTCFCAVVVVMALPPAKADVVRISPDKLDFGSRVFRTVTQGQATLTNGSHKLLNIFGMSIDGDYAIKTSDCGTTLPAGAACAIVLKTRELAAAARLNNGSVIITGGFDGQIYSPTTDLFVPAN